jgi:hypothetical protein
MIEEVKEKKPQPIKKFICGNIHLTIWLNEVLKDNKNFTVYNSQIVRSYKNSKDEWENTTTFRDSDLLNISIVSEKAYKYLKLKEFPKDEK